MANKAELIPTSLRQGLEEEKGNEKAQEQVRDMGESLRATRPNAAEVT